MCLGVPGEILEIHGDAPIVRMGKVRFGGITRDICLAYTPEARPGDYVIVHVGFSVSVVNAAEAERILATLQGFDE